MTTDNHARQIELEQEMYRFSLEKLQASIEMAKGKTAEENTAYGHRLTAAHIAAVAEALREALAPLADGRPVRRAIALKWLNRLQPEVAAAIGLRGVLSGITRARKLQRMAVEIGAKIADELLWQDFDRHDKHYTYSLTQHLQRDYSYSYRRQSVKVHAKRAGVEVEPVKESDRLHIGVKLIELVIQATGMVELVREEGMYKVVPTAETLKWIEDFTSWHAVASPEFWPMVVPPTPWTSPVDGGYLTPNVRPLTVIKRAKRNYIEELKHVEMPDVYAAVNAVQATAYTVDKEMLALIKTMWQTGVQVESLPLRSGEFLPPKPLDIATNEEARKAWRKAAALVHQRNHRALSKRVQLAQILRLATRFEDEPELYMPHQMDFRGRLYPTTVLSYQGGDVVRAILRFATGKPINDERAAGWLMIAGANLWGADKVSFEDRMAWAEEHADDIARTAADPMQHLWWTQADKPLQFLQWCREWRAFLAHGFGFVSNLIVAADGTCNGLQHYSAMLRDPVGGAATNLVPRPVPADIYSEVADVVLAKLRAISSGSVIHTGVAGGARDAVQWANAWLSFGVNRKTVKRAVMTLPYGCTRFGTRLFIEEAVRDRPEGRHAFQGTYLTDDGRWVESNGIFAASQFLAPLVWDAIGEVVVAARSAMEWLQEAASTIAKGGLPVAWRTPDGLPVQQAYYDTVDKRVALRMANVEIKMQLKQATDDVSRRRQQSGIAPNFVHSLDATALRRYVLYATQNGVNQFAMVHDSFGCTAADFDMMQACIRHAFVDLYVEHDVVRDMHAALQRQAPPGETIPPPPERGPLDITEVIQSDFFFA